MVLRNMVDLITITMPAPTITEAEYPEIVERVLTQGTFLEWVLLWNFQQRLEMLKTAQCELERIEARERELRMKLQGLLQIPLSGLNKKDAIDLIKLLREAVK